MVLNIFVFGQNFQIKSMGFFSDYNLSTQTKKKELSVNSVKGFGGGAEISYAIWDNLTMNISYGYQRLDIDQEKRPLFKEWSWRAWKRYYGDINSYSTDSLFLLKAPQSVIKLIRDNPAYKNMDIFKSFIPTQIVDIYPLSVSFAYELQLDQFSITPKLGGAILFYNRKLWVVEKWDKLFPELNFEYTYSFNNYCDKEYKGNPLSAQAGLDLTYNYENIVKFGFNVNYFYVFNTGKHNGYKHFPIKDLLSTKFQITFLY